MIQSRTVKNCDCIQLSDSQLRSFREKKTLFTTEKWAQPPSKYTPLKTTCDKYVAGCRYSLQN